MRDRRFVAVHRGDPLSPENHRALTQRATDCAEHVLPPVTGHGAEAQLQYIFAVARCWVQGEASVGEARTASLKALALARLLTRLPSP